MSSVYVVCRIFLKTFQTYIFAYRQTVWTLIRLLLEQHIVCKKWLLKLQADDKADDNCCDWQLWDWKFKG